MIIRKEYLYPRYQCTNDNFEWRNILNTITNESPIFHFSENFTGTHKFEPQSAHFTKKQFSLHCTVMHCEENGSLSLRYIYHLSNEMKHNAEFTFTVVKYLRICRR